MLMPDLQKKLGFRLDFRFRFRFLPQPSAIYIYFFIPGAYDSASVIFGQCSTLFQSINMDVYYKVKGDIHVLWNLSEYIKYYI